MQLNSSHLALVGLLIAGSTVGSKASAEVQCFIDVNLSIPANSEGLYVNLVTGTSGPSEGGVPGFDINIYAAVNTTPSGQMRFYWGPASTGAAGVVSEGDTYAVLVDGELVGPSSLFTRAAFTGNTDAWQAGTMGHLGLRLRNEATDSINYGWLLLATSAPMGFPAIVANWCYEDSGGAIDTPVFVSDFLFDDGFEAIAAQPTVTR